MRYLRKRRVIVLVGRHPNEGTINVAQRHHKDWEKHGVVVVRIPAQWTPHGFWHAAAKKDLPLEAVKAVYRRFPQDPVLINLLFKHGFRVPVVNFHGTPSSEYKEPFDPYLEIKTTRLTRIASHPLIEFVTPIEFLTHKPARNELVAEFYFHGAVSRHGKKATKFADYTIAVEEDRLGEAFPPDMEGGYLTDGRITRSALDFFSRHYAGQFEEVLAHLARTGLKK